MMTTGNVRGGGDNCENKERWLDVLRASNHSLELDPSWSPYQLLVALDKVKWSFRDTKIVKTLCDIHATRRSRKESCVKRIPIPPCSPERKYIHSAAQPSPTGRRSPECVP